MRGQNAKTPENLRRAEALRALGWTYKQIAAEIGVALSTVAEWLHGDPNRQERRARYQGACEECGGPTYGGNGVGKAPARCRECVAWTSEDILAAIRRWSERNGQAPCGEDFTGIEDMPHRNTVARHFGSWARGLVAAGVRPRQDKRPEAWEAIRAAIAAGERTADVAARFGVTSNAIHQRFRERGLLVSDLRKAA